ncbi:MliC family protein [uncultured Salinisphaera sp.]|uniref:MliC family protein n=1 Tax=uncultured Salinisphaera sp. TaxID=359372 RepID=UPI0032B23258|tara:strand:+ start:82 stop:543 length:462 start_codon:yes stop_codon:yes gene_type:complete
MTLSMSHLSRAAAGCFLAGAALGLAACAPSTLPQPSGSTESASPSIGGSLSGTPETDLTAGSANADGAPMTREYECNTGEVITVRYPDVQTAIVAYDGKKRAMHSAVVADGSRYVGHSYEWWTKGSGSRASASLYAHNADNSTGREILTCRPR